MSFAAILWCPYCKAEAKLVFGKAIYPKLKALWGKQFYLCEPCGAYVGCHPGSTVPLGGLANKDLRGWRQCAHKKLDYLWRNGPMKRSEAYAWLASELGLSRSKTHIGMFDVETCKRVVELCKEFRGPVSNVNTQTIFTHPHLTSQSKAGL